MVLQLQSSIRIALHNLYYYILHKYNFILAQQHIDNLYHWNLHPFKFQDIWNQITMLIGFNPDDGGAVATPDCKCRRPRQMTLIIPRFSYMPHGTCACACSMFGCLHCVHAPILLVAVGCIQNCHLVICLPHNLPKDACLLALLACSSYLIVCLT